MKEKYFCSQAIIRMIKLFTMKLIEALALLPFLKIQQKINKKKKRTVSDFRRRRRL